MKNLSNLPFADYSVLLSSDKMVLKTMLEKLSLALEKIDLKINLTKTKIR